MIISMVVCMARNRVIGRAGTMPWRMPSDLRHFKALTLGKTVIMGRKTYQSIGKPLPGRENIVVSRQPKLTIAGVEVAGSLEAALAFARAQGAAEAVIIGGGELYTQALASAQVIHVTQLAADIPGDTVFPAIDPEIWQIGSQSALATGPHDDHAADILTLTRIAVSKRP